MGEASISMFPQLAALALSAIVACSALPTSLVTDENVCTFIDFAQNVSQTCCLVPNPGYEKQNCYKGFEALNMGCCDTPQYWKQRGYDPSKQMGECYCAGGCFKTYNDKRAEMKCPKKQGLGAPLGGSCDPAGYVASIGTDGGDKGKCLEIKFGGGKLQSAFWLEEGWRYDPKREGKEWHDGKCDLTKFDNPAVTKDYAGWTEEKNGQGTFGGQGLHCGDVTMTKYEPKPKREGASLLGGVEGGSCDPTGYVASIGTDGADKGKCLEIAFGGGKLQSAFWLEEGWRYDPKRQGKLWHDGKCDLTKFDASNSTLIKDYAGWTEEKNGQGTFGGQGLHCGDVNMTKYEPKPHM